MATKKISLLDQIAAAEDVEEVTLPVPEWGEDVEILFRGMSLAALYTLQSIDMAAAENGDTAASFIRRAIIRALKDES